MAFAPLVVLPLALALEKLVADDAFIFLVILVLAVGARLIFIVLFLDTGPGLLLELPGLGAELLLDLLGPGLDLGLDCLLFLLLLLLVGKESRITFPDVLCQ